MSRPLRTDFRSGSRMNPARRLKPAPQSSYDTCHKKYIQILMLRWAFGEDVVDAGAVGRDFEGSLDGVASGLGVLEDAAGYDCEAVGAASHNALGDCGFESGDGSGGGGFGEDTGETAGVAHGVEDFVVADVEHRAAGFTDGNHRLAPVAGGTYRDTIGDD